jgi:hypothetical protein
MKYNIIKKAWSIDTSNLDEPWYYEHYGVIYGSRGEAKYKATNILIIDNAKTINNKDVDFLNVKIKRNKNFDVIDYYGEHIKRFKLKEIERKNKIKLLPKDKYYYVQDNRSYVGNAVLWWAKNGCGYVTDLFKAHKYNWDELQEFNPRDTDIIWEATHIEKAIRQYVDVQYLNNKFKI